VTVTELVVFVAIVIGLFGYWVSLKINPYVTCSRCKNNPRRKGLIFGYAHRVCPKCQGTGQQPRWGSKYLVRRP
jgi:DnaJ-class molecular chaperone